MSNLKPQDEQMITDRVAAKAAAREPLPAATIIRNSITTPDGTELVSRTRSDYVSYQDKNGYLYAVDGGRDYLKHSYNPDAPATDTSVALFAGHEIVREAYEWGTRGKDGTEELSWVPLKDMLDEHLEALINDCYPATPLFIAEQKWRESVISRKEIRRADIDRLIKLKDKYEQSPSATFKLDGYLVDIVARFNANEFGEEDDN